MKIFNRNNLVLAMACFLATASIVSAENLPCSNDDDCTSIDECFKCECDVDDVPPTRRLEEEKPRALRMVNEQAAAVRNSKRGFEFATAQTRRAKSCKTSKTGKANGTCVYTASKSGKTCKAGPV